MLNSETEREITEFGARVSNDVGNNDRDEDGSLSRSGRTDFDRKQGRNRGFIGAKVKHVFMFPFTKSNKNKQTKIRSKRSRFSSSGKRVDDSGDVVCSCFCFTPPRRMEKPADDSKISDPNDPTFTYGMLKALIESNHFYSKECNSHSV